MASELWIVNYTELNSSTTENCRQNNLFKKRKLKNKNKYHFEIIMKIKFQRSEISVSINTFFIPRERIWDAEKEEKKKSFYSQWTSWRPISLNFIITFSQFFCSTSFFKTVSYVSDSQQDGNHEAKNDRLRGSQIPKCLHTIQSFFIYIFY